MALYLEYKASLGSCEVCASDSINAHARTLVKANRANNRRHKPSSREAAILQFKPRGSTFSLARLSNQLVNGKKEVHQEVRMAEPGRYVANGGGDESGTRQG